MRGKVLKLNASYIPIDVISLKKAMRDIQKGKVEVVEIYDTLLLRHGTGDKGGTIPFPAVVRLMHFNSPKTALKFYKPFNRRNVWERDDRCCQYCRSHISLNEMEYDHVYPQSRGGLTNWTNIVSSCTDCNRKKANKTCVEAGMYPMKVPVAPLIAEGYIGGMLDQVRFKIGTMELSDHVWKTYLNPFSTKVF